MHPDRKIGIAMGILLVGVVGALFFRNEPLDVDATLDAHRERDLNQKLSDRDVALYENSDASSEEKPTEDTHRRLDELLKKRDSDTPDRSFSGIYSADHNRTAISEHNHEPLSFESPPKSVTEIAEADGDPDANHSTPAETEIAAIIEQAAPEQPLELRPQDYEEYTVQFGDTLSEIAEKFLGSQTKYRQIYDANRDRMKSPDHLRVGSAIRIPRVIH